MPRTEISPANSQPCEINLDRGCDAFWLGRDEQGHEAIRRVRVRNFVLVRTSPAGAWQPAAQVFVLDHADVPLRTVTIDRLVAWPLPAEPA